MRSIVSLFMGLFLAIGMVFLATSGIALAYTIEDHADIPVLNDFVVGPTKHELFLDPGQTAKTQLYIMNRMGKPMSFQLKIEDFTGSYDPEQTVVLLGDERGPYTLKDYIKPEITEFILSHGQRIYLPIEITVPEDAEAGGLYGAILVSTNPPGVSLEAGGGEVGSGVTVRTRIASLFFVTVRGEVEQKGALKEFRMEGRPNYGFYQQGPFGFEIYFENQGNVHLVPYGKITVTNMMGKEVGEMEIDPYFAMPQSLRARKVVWATNQLMFGKYTATLNLNRGYNDIIDTMSIDFWVIPLKKVGTGFGIIVLVVLILWWITSRFEIRFKSSSKSNKSNKSDEKKE